MKLFFIFLTFLLLISSSNSFLCTTCIQSVQVLQNLIIAFAPQSTVQDAVRMVCERQYDSQDLCAKVTQQLTPLAIKSGVKGILKEGRLCEKVCPKQFYSTFDIKNIQDALNEQPIQFHLNEKNAQNFTLKKTLNTNIRVLHLTDIHLDLNYTEKSSTVCSYPICCHSDNGFPQAQTVQAKPYGNIRCDTPMKLLDKALDFIQEKVSKIDIVVVTGDYSAHNQWQKTPQTVLYVRGLVQQKIKQKVNAEVIVTSPGNNQYLPDHQVDPTSVSQEAIKVSKIYRPQINDQITIISINTLFCDNINLYLIQDQTQSIRQLKMLDHLLGVNKNVYIIGHIAPTSQSCSQTYSLIYRTILSKHKNNVLGQFFGHTHTDEFIVNTDPKNEEIATSFSLLGGSLSPLSSGNSRFRVYQLNGESFELQNYYDYSFTQSENNQNTFSLGYDFKKYYGLPLDRKIDADTMKDFQNQIISNLQIRKKYNSKLSGRQIPISSKNYCQTYDDQKKRSECSGNQTKLSMEISNKLQLLQGKWGSYGQNIQ